MFKNLIFLTTLINFLYSPLVNSNSVLDDYERDMKLLKMKCYVEWRYGGGGRYETVVIENNNISYVNFKFPITEQRGNVYVGSNTKKGVTWLVIFDYDRKKLTLIDDYWHEGRDNVEADCW